MERREVLLGSGALFTTLLAGCVGSEDQNENDENDSTGSDPDEGTNGDGGSNGSDGDNGNSDDGQNDDGKGDEGDNNGEEGGNDEEEKENIPGFDQENFKVDSDLIHIKEVEHHDHRLTTKVMLTTTDRSELAEGLQALAPAFENAIRDADAEKFFAEVEELEFRLYGENEKSRVVFLLDVRWLQQFMDGDMTNEEFVNEVLDEMEGVPEETEQN